MNRTYLQPCLKEDHLVRWPDSVMPIKVYVAPFTWYDKKKQSESDTYRQLILDCLQTWRVASDHLVQFQVVNQLEASQIDFKWRRVDRQSLGHCSYEHNQQYQLFSAEVQIGISDGIIHGEYQRIDEVKHTVLHEIGHALGLIGHSDGPEDIMYVPHQYGIYNLSPRDIETIQWLYRLPVGFHYKGVGQQYNLPSGFTVDQVIDKIESRIQSTSDSEETLTNTPSSTEYEPVESGSGLDEHHAILSHMGKFHLQTQNIQLTPQQQKQLDDMTLAKKLKRHRRPPYA